MFHTMFRLTVLLIWKILIILFDKSNPKVYNLHVTD